MFNILLNLISDIMFPPRCVHCQRIGVLLCRSCIKSILPAPQTGTAVIAAGTIKDPILSAAIHAFKYCNLRQLAEPLAMLMARQAASTNIWSSNPLLVPVPLHPGRLRERGYNQAELLADQLAKMAAMKMAPDILVRTHDTSSQVKTRSRQERLENMIGAFICVQPEMVRGRDIVIIDDVCTTGATLDACGQALKNAGARKITALAVARAVK
jgi:ComF family protein